MTRQATSADDLASCIRSSEIVQRGKQLRGDLSPDGSIGESVIYASFGISVHLFTYRGGQHGDAFTVLKTQFRGKAYRVSISRFYPVSWWQRLANRFARHVFEFSRKG